MRDLIKKFLLWFQVNILRNMYTPQDIQPILDVLNSSENKFSWVGFSRNYELDFNYSTINQIRFRITYSNGGLGFFYTGSGLIEILDLSTSLSVLFNTVHKKERMILTEFQRLLTSKNLPI